MLRWLLSMLAPAGAGTQTVKAGRMPTVRFDASRVVPSIEQLVREALAEAPEMSLPELERVLPAVLDTIREGRDLFACSAALSSVSGMTPERAGALSLMVHNRASALMNNQRQLELGIKYAKWLYSGAPCAPGDDDAHKAASGKRYEILKGMRMGRRRVWPGMEPGCKCVGTSVIPGFEDED